MPPPKWPPYPNIFSRELQNIFVKWEKLGSETYAALREVFGNNIMSKLTSYERFQAFQVRWEECYDADNVF